MRYYPLFLDLSRTHCLVVGAGAVGRRKLATLLECAPASVLVLDTRPPDAALLPLLQNPTVSFARRAFTTADVEGRGLVFAATGDGAVNAAVAAACRRNNILCNCADAPREGNIIIPATARSGPLTAALSTGGGSPALARGLRRELESWLEPRAALAALLGRLRPHALALMSPPEVRDRPIAIDAETRHTTALFRAVAQSPLREALTRGDRVQCEKLLRELLPDALHPYIPELLYDLV